MIEDFNAALDRDGMTGLIQPDGSFSGSQNGTLFSTEALICLADSNHYATFQEAERLKEVFSRCEPEFGLSSRSPTSREIDSMDNTVALLAFSAVYDQGQFAKRMYQRGKLVTDGVDLHDQGEKTLKMLKWARLLNFGFMPNHVWNVANPGKFNIRAWWGRSPAMLGLSRMTAGKWCNPLLWFAVLVGQFIGVFKNPLDSDSRTLPHVVWHYLKTRGLFWQLAYKFWYYVAFTRWKYSLKQVYTNYFGAAHPITKHTKN